MIDSSLLIIVYLLLILSPAFSLFLLYRFISKRVSSLEVLYRRWSMSILKSEVVSNAPPTLPVINVPPSPGPDHVHRDQV